MSEWMDNWRKLLDGVRYGTPEGIAAAIKRAGDAQLEQLRAMNRPSVASLDLCREVYAVSGWNGTVWSWYCDEEHDDDPGLNLSEPVKVIGGVGYFDRQYPAYDLGYLVRMLPGHYVQKMGNGTYIARWTDYAPTAEQRALGTNHLSGHSRTSPENAVCRLVLALFEHEILLRVAKREEAKR